MKKIAFVLPDLAAIGAQRYAIGISKVLEERGYDIEFLLMIRTGHFINEIREEKIYSFEASLFKNIRILRVFEAVFLLLKKLRRDNYDIILCVSPFLNRVVTAFKMLRLTKSELVIEEHGYPPQSLNSAEDSSSIISRIFLRKTFWLYRYADNLRVVSIAMLNYFNDKLKITKNARFFPSLIDLTRIQYLGEQNSSLLVGNHKCKIVFLGRLVEQKNIPFLLECFSDIRKKLNCHLWLIGDGPKKESLVELVKQLNLEDGVTFCGYMENPYNVLKQGDVFVMTSIWEGLPQVIVEAMTLKVPVVSVDCNTGPSEIIGPNSERGWLVVENNKQRFVSALMEALTDKDKAQGKSNRAYKYVMENYDLKTCINKYIELFLTEVKES